MIWNVDPVFFTIPLVGREIRYYGVLYAVALMGAFYFWQKQILRSGRTQEQADRFLMLGVGAVIAGARIGHCLFYSPTFYLQNPWEIVKVWEGGLASHGATITLLLTLVYYARTEQMTIREVLDRFAIAVAWAASIIRLGNLMNSEIVGRLTDSVFAFKFPLYDRRFYNSCTGCETSSSESCISTVRGCVDLTLVEWRHPSQLYEFFMGMAIFAVLIFVDRWAGKEKRPLGLLGGLFLLLYFTGRFLVEYVKEYQALSQGFTMGQYLSIPFMLIGGFLVYKALVTPEPTPELQQES